jgi:hypothetical protein
MISVLGFLSLSACSAPTTPAPIEIVTTPLSYSKPIVPRVDEISLRETTWIVVTQTNYAGVFARLRDEGREPILYALTSDGYVSLVSNQVDILKLVRQQKRVIATYENWQY